MNQNLLRARIARSFLYVIASCGAVAPARAQLAEEAVAQIAAVNLDRYVVSAARAPQDPKYTPSAVSAVVLQDLERSQIGSLRHALAREPGVILHNNGATGSLSTIFLRGASAHQTLFVVDGVRMNDRSSTFQNYLAGAGLGDVERVEILRGPQSTLYGSSAIGGVILIETTRGEGAAAGEINATAGAFETFAGAGSVEGEARGLSYSGSVSRYETDNERAGNDYEVWSYATRLEYAASEALVLGATFRGQDSDYNEPGSRLFPSPGSVEFGNYLTSVYGEAKAGEALRSRVTLAKHVRDYLYRSAFGVSPLRNDREILDWQNTWEATERAQIVAGVNLEDSKYTVDGVPSSDRVAAGYVSGTWRLADALTLIGGFRHDDFKSVGGATTGRGGFAWLPRVGTKVRATYGTGFAAPGSDDVYGVPSYNQLPSPGLLPEESRGWDVGVDHELANGAATLSATYFRNEFRNLFEYETVDFTTFAGRTVNRARASAEGVELALAGKLGARMNGRVSYTYLEAHNDLTGARLIRRPRHTGDVEVTAEAARGWVIGAGVRVVADRLDTGGPIEDYAVARVFTSYAVGDDLILKMRVENALDEAYEEVLGYAALSRGVYGSVEWRF